MGRKSILSSSSSSSRGFWDSRASLLAGILHKGSQGRTLIPYIPHLVLGSGEQPSSRFLVLPCAIHLLVRSTSASLSPRDVTAHHSHRFVPTEKLNNYKTFTQPHIGLKKREKNVSRANHGEKKKNRILNESLY